MTQFSAASYWPFPGSLQRRTNEYTNGISNIYTFAADTPAGGGKGICLRQFINGNQWDSDWFYRNDPVRGILEYEDDYPAPSWMFWSKTKNCLMASCKEIIWGGTLQNVGDVIHGQCEIARGIGFGPMPLYGWQQVQFIDILSTYTVTAGTFSNVLKLQYWQTWANSPNSSGAIMWLAPDIGQLRAEWTKNGVPSGYSMSLTKTETI
jgi:hypothetical protein